MITTAITAFIQKIYHGPYCLSLTLNNSKGSIFCRLCFVGEKNYGMKGSCNLLKVHVAKSRAETQAHTVQTQTLTITEPTSQMPHLQS